MRHQKCCFVDQSFGLYSVLLLVKSRRLPRIRRIIAKRSGEERIDHTFGSCGTCDWVKGGGESLIRILGSVCLFASQLCGYDVKSRIEAIVRLGGGVAGFLLWGIFICRIFLLESNKGCPLCFPLYFVRCLLLCGMVIGCT